MKLKLTEILNEQPPRRGRKKARVGKRVKTIAPSRKPIKVTDRPDLDAELRGILKYDNVIAAKVSLQNMDEYWVKYLSKGDREGLRRLKQLSVVAQNRTKFLAISGENKEDLQIYRMFKSWIGTHVMPKKIIQRDPKEKNPEIIWSIKYKAVGPFEDKLDIKSVSLVTALKAAKRELNKRFDKVKILGPT